MKKQRKLICSLLIILTVLCSTFIPIPAHAAETLEQNCLYYLKNKASGKYLTASSSNNLIQSTLTRTENQRFRMSPTTISDGQLYYRVILDGNNKNSFCVDGNTASNGTNISVSELTLTMDHHQFAFELNPDNSYKISTKMSTAMYLTVENSSTSDGANILLHSRYNYGTQNSGSQDFYLYKASKSIMSHHLVDSGKHLDYKTPSTYQTYCNTAQNTWNGYKAGVVRKNSLLNITDVTIKEEVNYTDTSYAITNYNSRKIYVYSNNIANLDSNPNKELILKSIFIHEFGHALGMGHIWQSNNVMNWIANTTTTLNHYNEVSYDLAYDEY